MTLDAISKKSFGPISLLVPRFHAEPDDPSIFNMKGGPKILEILEYACYRSDCYAVGFKLGPAANLNQNPFFEMASSHSFLFWS
jgi:hypothetical protein